MSTTPQTEAQRLADEALVEYQCGALSVTTGRKMIAELRRLDSENSDLRERNAAMGNAQEIALDTATEHALAADELRSALTAAETERDQLRERVDGLEREVKHWMSNHTNEVARARILKERADMPLERVKAYELVETLRAQVDALTDSAAAKADRIDRLGEMVERLYLGMQQAMAKLTTLLDEDQFAHIESIMTGAGITPPDVERLRGGEPAVRFCPGCGSVGAVPDTFKDCCPDGNHARMIPESLARRCNDLFYLALNAAQPAAPANSEPFGYFRADAMGWTDCAADDAGAIALYERPAAPAVPQGITGPARKVILSGLNGLGYMFQIAPITEDQRIEWRAWSHSVRALLAESSEPAVPQGLEPAGFLLHWPAPGGSREIIWSDSRISGDAIGCPVTPVFKLAATPAAPSQPVPLTDEQIKALVMSWAHDYGKTTADLIRSVEAHHGICTDGREAKP